MLQKSQDAEIIPRSLPYAEWGYVMAISPVIRRLQRVSDNIFGEVPDEPVQPKVLVFSHQSSSNSHYARTGLCREMHGTPWGSLHIPRTAFVHKDPDFFVHHIHLMQTESFYQKQAFR